MTAEQESRPSRPSALSADDWTARALELVMAEGPGAVKISRLCRDLGVTKGSFYWHFADLESLKEAAVERWCLENDERLRALASLTDVPPLERLRTMTLGLLDQQNWNVQRTMRDWARTDDRVAATVAESDRSVFALVQGAIEELGPDPREARMRAGLLVYAGIGFAHGQSGLPRPEAADVDDMIAFLADR